MKSSIQKKLRYSIIKIEKWGVIYAGTKNNNEKHRFI